MTKRIFFAVDIIPGPVLLEAFTLIRQRLRLEKINWVSPGQLHITLAFLGEIPKESIPAIITGVEPVVAGHRAFGLTLSSVGVFRSLRDPGVLWIGCDPVPEFRNIKQELDQVLTGFGYEPENRAFSPHLTLGRIRGLRNHNQLSQIITLYKDVVFQEQVMHHVVLYESRLTPAGPEYLPLKRFTLKS